MKTRSMYHKISLQLFLLSLLGFLFAAILTITTFYRAFETQAWRGLEIEAHTIAIAYEQFTDKQDIAHFANEDLRVTLYDSDANVLYESEKAESEAVSKGDWNEIQTALLDGTAAYHLRSNFFGSDTYYYAVLLSDGCVLRLAQSTRNLWSIFYQALPAILASFVVFIFISIAISYHCTKHIIAPILEMTQDLEHIQNNVPYKELAPFVSAIYSDRLLRENNEKIRQEFTANVSHELKSPLTSISGYAELIETGMAKAPDIPGFATRIHTEALRMITLVEDILRLSQLDTMRETISEPVSFESINLYDLGKECVERQTINAKRAYVTLSFEGVDAIIQGNRQLLTELFQNLCDNAIRYNKPGGKVFLQVGRGKDNVPFLYVQDNGIGIPADAQSRIFERFYRVDKSHSKETGGTGLGLAIVKHIILVHSARIALESELGKGTEITVFFSC